MKKGIHILLVTLLSSFMFGCGENTGSVSTNSDNSSRSGIPPIDFRDLEGNGFSNRSTSISLDLDENLAGYNAIDLQVDLGTVFGNGLDAKFGGDIIAYVDYANGDEGLRFFTTGGNVEEDVQENFWYYSRDNKLIWRGVFEGPRGALIIVIDGVFSSGDGNEARDLMSGSVWLRPWPVVTEPVCFTNSRGEEVCDRVDRPCVINSDGRTDCKNPNAPPARCWNVSLGPYDCRFDISDDGQVVEALGNIYADQNYIKLGTFDDLSRQEVFRADY